jgi:hypothetical protein
VKAAYSCCCVALPRGALYLLPGPAYLAEKSLECIVQLSLGVGEALRACRTKRIMDSMRAYTGARVFALYWSRWIEPGLSCVKDTLASKMVSSVITPLKVFISCLIVQRRRADLGHSHLTLPQPSANANRLKHVDDHLELARSCYFSGGKYEVSNLATPVLVDLQTAVLFDKDETQTF